MATTPRSGKALRQNDMTEQSEKQRAQAISDATAEFSGGAEVMTGKGRLRVPSGDVIVMCRTPGFRRLGREHSGLEVWPAGDLSDDEIAILEKDPQFEVVRVL